MKTNFLKQLQERQFQRHVRWYTFLSITLLFWIVTNGGPLALRLCATGTLAWFLLYCRSGNRVPVLMYHSVSANGNWLQHPDLVVNTRSFKAQLAWLQKHGYQTLQLDELYDGRSAEVKFDKAVALTFDDGYLDAWVAVEPLLKHHGHKGTVYVSSSWIEDGDTPRPQLREADEAQSYWEGYLNRSEVHQLKQRGILDVQSHGASHDRIFTGNKIESFITENPPPLWLYLLHHPEARTNWFKTKLEMPLGQPIFQAGEALAAPAFHPNLVFCRELEITATDNSHLSKRKLLKLLTKRAEQLIEEGVAPGRQEAPDQTTHRWRMELQRSKQILEEITGRSINHLCWPSNVWNPQSEALALETGYRSTANGDDHNGPEKPWRVSRVHIGGIGNPSIDLLRFILEIQVFRGHYWLWPLLLILQKVMVKTWQTQKKRQVWEQQPNHLSRESHQRLT